MVPPRRIAPKPSVSGIAHGVGMTPACWAGALACTGRWYGPKPLTTMVWPKLGLELQQRPQFGSGKYPRNLVHLYIRQLKTKLTLQDSDQPKLVAFCHQKLQQEFSGGFFCKNDETQKYNIRITRSIGKHKNINTLKT